MKFEHKNQPLASHAQFRRRVLRHFLSGSVLIGFSLAIGTIGYCYFGQLSSVVDGFYNASMILTGMGPVNPMTCPEGKIFASIYALYSGIAFLTAVSIVVAPVLHRLLHRLHLDDDSPSL
ncbi:MAG: hypothetical protein IT258_17705 [Saprospiraceae bacterium]|nr:hypothetical protein [Saprospiraceae bacterium]